MHTKSLFSLTVSILSLNVSLLSRSLALVALYLRNFDPDSWPRLNVLSGRLQQGVKGEITVGGIPIKNKSVGTPLAGA